MRNYDDKFVEEIMKERVELLNKISDLEAKLAESEKKPKFLEGESKFFNDAYQSKKKHYDIVYNELSKVYDENNQLKQQLAETDKLMQEYLSKCLSLEQQLADKEKELYKSRQEFWEYFDKLDEKSHLYEIQLLENVMLEQSQTQTAIAELEKVKKLLDDCYGYEYTSLYHFIQSKAEEKIDQQIKELKGEK